MLILGGSGVGATAVAQFDPVLNQVTNILITSAGTGYLPTDNLAVQFWGGGYTTVAVPGAYSFNANVNTGGLTKAFMGKDFVNDMNATMDQGQAAIDGINQQQWLAQNGLDASADVLMVQDTGATVNMNPVVLLQMKVTPAAGAPFDVTTQTMVSRIAVPREPVAAALTPEAS